MDVIAQTFWLPRRGNSPAEYEDAWAANPASGRYAVADGASEGCFTGLWARLLVEDFVGRADQGLEPWPTSLSAIQRQWDSDVRGRNLPYHAEPWVRRGAYAAFLGLVLLTPLALWERGRGWWRNSADSPRPPGEGQGVRADCFRWQAIAVGDTCLFHTRGTALLRAFPLEDSHQFNNAPKLVALARRRKSSPSLPGMARWPRPARRSSLVDDRRLGAMVPGRAEAGAILGPNWNRS